MDNIKDILGRVIAGMSVRTSQNEEHKLEEQWQIALEKDEPKHVRLVGLRNGLLLVNVDSPAWLYQMNLRRVKILERLKSEMPNIQNISFKIGKVK